MKTNNGVDYLREKLIDYYGSATPFFAVAHADVVRIEHNYPKIIFYILNRFSLFIAPQILSSIKSTLAANM
jgi:hypothetical protein